MKSSQKGFSVIEGLLLLVILGLLGFVGWYVYTSSNQTKETLNAADKSTSQSAQTETKAKSQPIEQDLIIKAVAADCEAYLGNTASDISVGKQQSTYAVVTLKCGNEKDGTPTSRAYLKKVNETWTIVVRGSGTPTTSEDLKPFGFPVDFLN